MSLRLSVTNAKKGGPPRDYDFANGPVRMGRASTSDVVLEGDMVSRTHILLEEVDGGWQASHAGSITPTLLNGKSVKAGRPERLDDGDVLQVADHKVQVAIVMETIMPELEPLRDSFVSRIESEDADRTRVASSRGPAPAPMPPPAAPRPGPAGRTVPTLAVFAGLPEPARLELREVGRSYSLGRSATCDLVLPVGAVSRQHAFARYDGTRVYLRDAGARNPALVNGRPIVGEVPLNHGDTVTIGAVELRFASEPEAAGGAPTGVGEFGAQGATVVLDRSAPPAAPGAWTPGAAPAAAPGAGWDALARGDDAGGAPGWQPEPVPSLDPMAALPPEPEPLPVPPPASAPDWSAMAAPPREVAPPTAFASPRPAPAAPSPPPPAWDVPEAAAPAFEAPPAPAPQFSAPPPPPAPPPMPAYTPPAPAQPAPLPPPGPAGGVADPKVVARRAPSYRGWLIAGIASMILAVTVGLLLVIVAL